METILFKSIDILVSIFLTSLFWVYVLIRMASRQEALKQRVCELNELLDSTSAQVSHLSRIIEALASYSRWKQMGGSSDIEAAIDEITNAKKSF